MNTKEYNLDKELDEDLEDADAWLEKEFGRPVEHLEDEDEDEETE